MAEKLYTTKDVANWKVGDNWEREHYTKKLKSRNVGDRLPRQMAVFFCSSALTAIAEQDWPEALACFKGSVICDLLLWQELQAGASDPSSLESIGIIGSSPILLAGILNAGFMAEASELFRRNIGLVGYPKGVLLIGDLLGRIARGESGAPIEFSKPGNHTQLIANAFYSRNEKDFREELYLGATEQYQYIRKNDRGFPESAAYPTGLCFIRLARELWLKDFEIDHVMLPLGILDHEPNDSFDKFWECR